METFEVTQKVKVKKQKIQCILNLRNIGPKLYAYEQKELKIVHRSKQAPRKNKKYRDGKIKPEHPKDPITKFELKSEHPKDPITKFELKSEHPKAPITKFKLEHSKDLGTLQGPELKPSQKKATSKHKHVSKKPGSKHSAQEKGLKASPSEKSKNSDKSEISNRPVPQCKRETCSRAITDKYKRSSQGRKKKKLKRKRAKDAKSNKDLLNLSSISSSTLRTADDDWFSLEEVSSDSFSSDAFSTSKLDTLIKRTKDRDKKEHIFPEYIKIGGSTRKHTPKGAKKRGKTICIEDSLSGLDSLQSVNHSIHSQATVILQRQTPTHGIDLCEESSPEVIHPLKNTESKSLSKDRKIKSSSKIGKSRDSSILNSGRKKIKNKQNIKIKRSEHNLNSPSNSPPSPISSTFSTYTNKDLLYHNLENYPPLHPTHTSADLQAEADMKRFPVPPYERCNRPTHRYPRLRDAKIDLKDIPVPPYHPFVPYDIPLDYSIYPSFRKVFGGLDPYQPIGMGAYPVNSMYYEWWKM